MSDVTIAQIEIELGRTLSDDEAVRAEQLTLDAETIIRARIKDLDTRLKDTNYGNLLDMVIRAAVARVMRNPMGIRTEAEGDRNVQLDTIRVSSGYLTILDTEWELLGGAASGAYTVNPNAWRMNRLPEPFGWLPDGRPLRWVYLT